MTRKRLGLALGWVLATWIGTAAFSQADSPPEKPAKAKAGTAAGKPDVDPAGLARRAWAVADVIAKNHLQPPARLDLLAGGIRAFLKKAGAAVPDDLDRKVAALNNEQALAKLMRELWARGAAAEKAVSLDEELLQGMVDRLPGKGKWVPAFQARAIEQSMGNRYVGIGIQIRLDPKQDCVEIVTPFRGGPADRAGIKPHDAFVRIDDHDAKGANIRQVVEWLRGDAGTTVHLVMRPAGASRTRECTVTRGVVPFDSVFGYRRTADGWDYRVDPALPIAYVWVDNLFSSTVHDLRRVERRLRQEGIRAVVLDLRSGQGGELHHVALVADALLDEGPLWTLHGPGGRVTAYRSDPDCLFRDCPLAVLVDRRLEPGQAALVAALQDRGRAVVIGEPGRDDGYVESFHLVPGTGEAVVIRTGRLDRASGKSWPVTPDRPIAVTGKQRDAVAEWLHLKSQSEGPVGDKDRAPDDPALREALGWLKTRLPGA